MRSHLQAVQTIVGLIAQKQFTPAADVAQARLGLTEEMKSMCSMFENEAFRELGFAFHKSGDALSETLKTGNVEKSLQALQETLGYCVQCHATYRQ